MIRSSRRGRGMVGARLPDASRNHRHLRPGKSRPKLTSPSAVLFNNISSAGEKVLKLGRGKRLRAFVGKKVNIRTLNKLGELDTEPRHEVMCLTHTHFGWFMFLEHDF